MQKTILIIDDEEDIRMLIQGLLEDEGYRIFTAANSGQAYDIIRQESIDLIVQDVWLQGSADDGIEILKTIKAERSNLPFLMISGHGTIETAVSAIKLGAYDFIEKPFKSDRLLLMIERALENANLKTQNANLKQQSQDDISKRAEQMPDAVRVILDKAANSNSRIFIVGEGGTGKMLAARYLHAHSPRADKPFLTLNCAGKDGKTIEEELFGSVLGGENGDLSQRGLLELVNTGTLVLDGVLSLPLDTQGKILNFIQTSSYCPIGSNEKRMIDIRIISISGDIPELHIQAQTFREDLYYRLNVVPVVMAALRERRSDISRLIALFCDLRFSDAALAKLKSYEWPGNIKQLYNVLEWVGIMHQDKDQKVAVDGLPPELSGTALRSEDAPQNDGLPSTDDILEMSLREARERFERYYLISQINKFDGNISKTANFIGMERSALHRKLKSLDVFSDDKKNVA